MIPNMCLEVSPGTCGVQTHPFRTTHRGEVAASLTAERTSDNFGRSERAYRWARRAVVTATRIGHASESTVYLKIQTICGLRHLTVQGCVTLHMQVDLCNPTIVLTGKHACEPQSMICVYTL